MRFVLLAQTPAAGTSGVAPGNPYAIQTITDNGSGFARVTTEEAHGLSGSETVTIRDTSSAAYNDQTATVGDVTGTTFDLDIEYVENATGGTWENAG